MGFGQDRRRRRPRLAAVAAAALLALIAGARASEASAPRAMTTVAVFPVENLSLAGAPSEEVRRVFVSRLGSAGVTVLAADVLDAFMTRHRVRYAAGIDGPTAELLRKETGAEGVVIVSFEYASASDPPKIALLARLVSITADPAVVWADDAGLSGDDAPGFFERGLVRDYQTLLARALERVSGSLAAYLETGQTAAAPKAASKFRPKTSHRALALGAGAPRAIAVVPFFNLSDRRSAGQILALLFVRHLSGQPRFRVVEPGATRRQFLDARIIMDGGLSISDAMAVAEATGADFVLGGRVVRYEDYEGPAGRTRVEFSTALIEKKSGKVVWSSASDNEGSDGVRLFERGTSRTAHAMATRMVQLTVDGIVGGDR